MKYKTKMRMGQYFMGVWIGALACAFGIPGFWGLRESVVEFEAGDNVRWALVVGVLSLVLIWVSFRGLIITVNVLLGKTSARLAKRDFRNILSNIAMGAKTGMWKE